MKDRDEKNCKIYEKDKLGLREVIKMDGRMSFSKVTKILAKIGDIKAQEMNYIPKIFQLNGRKRIFRRKDVVDWMERPNQE